MRRPPAENRSYVGLGFASLFRGCSTWLHVDGLARPFQLDRFLVSPSTPEITIAALVVDGQAVDAARPPSPVIAHRSISVKVQNDGPGTMAAVGASGWWLPPLN